MSPTSPNGRSEWRIAISPLIMQRLRDFGEAVGVAFAEVLRKVYRGLRETPEEFGEPLYHLPDLPGQVRHAAIAPLVVAYAVYPEERVVWLFRVWLLTLTGSAG
jgi:hypothetical protein